MLCTLSRATLIYGINKKILNMVLLQFIVYKCLRIVYDCFNALLISSEQYQGLLANFLKSNRDTCL